MKKWLSAIVHSLFVRMLVFITICYWVADWFLPQTTLNTILTALSLCLAAAVVFLYWPSARDAFLKRDLTNRDRLVMGIMLSWGARVILSAVALVTLLAGKIFKYDFNTTSYFGYVFTIVMLAAVFHVTAPAMTNDLPPRRDWRSVWIALCFGFAIAGFVLGIAWVKATEG